MICEFLATKFSELCLPPASRVFFIVDVTDISPVIPTTTAQICCDRKRVLSSLRPHRNHIIKLSENEFSTRRLGLWTQAQA